MVPAGATASSMAFAVPIAMVMVGTPAVAFHGALAGARTMAMGPGGTVRRRGRSAAVEVRRRRRWATLSIMATATTVPFLAVPVAFAASATLVGIVGRSRTTVIVTSAKAIGISSPVRVGGAGIVAFTFGQRCRRGVRVRVRGRRTTPEGEGSEK